MTTGRINQVCMPSSAREASANPAPTALWQRSRGFQNHFEIERTRAPIHHFSAYALTPTSRLSNERRSAHILSLTAGRCMRTCSELAVKLRAQRVSILAMGTKAVNARSANLLLANPRVNCSTCTAVNREISLMTTGSLGRQVEALKGCPELLTLSERAGAPEKTRAPGSRQK